MLVAVLFARVFTVFGTAVTVGESRVAFVPAPRRGFRTKERLWRDGRGSISVRRNPLATVNRRKHLIGSGNSVLVRGIYEDAENDSVGGEGQDDKEESGEEKDEDNNDDGQVSSGSCDGSSLDDKRSSAIDFGDLAWRVEKMRLEEANTRRFLKAGPKFLPYTECRNWVRAWNRWETEKEWLEWIDEGEKRNSYIPSRPDEYYGNLGHWKGWDHFLGKIDSAKEENTDRGSGKK